MREYATVDIFGDIIEIEWNGNVWVSPVDGQQHSSSRRDAMETELRAYYRASGDDPDEQEIADQIARHLDSIRERATSAGAASAEVVDEIRQAKSSAGDDAYVWLHSSGDCILWPDEEASVDDAGIHALGRWQLDDAAADALTDARLVDDYA